MMLFPVGIERGEHRAAIEREQCVCTHAFLRISSFAIMWVWDVLDGLDIRTNWKCIDCNNKLFGGI